MSHYAVICPIEGMEQMAQLQWISVLRRLGHQVEVYNLFSPRADPRIDLSGFVSKVVRNSPEIIFVEGAIGFSLPEFYLHPTIQQITVAAFWFDDPWRPVCYRKNQKGYLDALRLPNVSHFVWDGYWRKWLFTNHQVRSFPIHLAADPDEFRPLPRSGEYPDHAVFIGTLVNLRHLEELKRKLPPVLRHIASLLPSAMEGAPYGTNPYDILDGLIKTLPAKMISACESLREKEPDAVLNLHAFASKIGKNEVRKRILRETLKVAPLLIFCGNFERTHAGEKEIRAILNTDSNRLIVRDTGDINPSNLASLYAYGKIHLQATDPQSVEGGIPFRVFQTTATRRPLLTDKKPELAKCYSYGKELLTFESDRDFADTLQAAMADPEKLDDVAQNSYRRFLRDHTWEKRFEYVVKTIKTAVAA